LGLGCVTVIFQYFAAPLVAPGGFGFSRWLGGFIDVVSLPVLVPLVVYFLLVALKAIPPGTDQAGFTLLWLIPMAAFYSVSSYSHGSPVTLVLVPLLWTAQGTGISFFCRIIIHYSRWYISVPLVLGCIALPLTAATSWWAFFSHQTSMGFLLLFVSLVPLSFSVVCEAKRR
jgi:hypothetical protein